MDAAKLAEAIRFAAGRESTRAHRLLGSGAHLRQSLLGSVPTRRGCNQRPRHLQGLRGRRVRRPDGRRSDVLGGQEHAGDRRRRRRARRAACALDDPVGRTITRRRLRLAAQRAGHLEDAPAAGERVGRRDVGQAPTISSAARPSAKANGSRAPCRPPGAFYEYNDVRINRFAPVAAAHVRPAGARRVPGRRSWTSIGASSTWKWVPYPNS